MRSGLQSSVATILGLVTAVHAGTAEPKFRRQTIEVPASPGAWRGWLMTCLADVEGDGLVDLLAVCPVKNKLWVYKQRASGFPPKPDQQIDLPAQTAWIALCDVENHPGLELLLSTATGLACLRQNDGVFDGQPHTLVNTNQVFTKETPIRLLSLDRETSRTNPLLPVFSASHATFYQRTSEGVWSAGPPLPLRERGNQWSIEDGGWSMGSTRSRRLAVRQSFRVAPIEEPEREAEEKMIRGMLVNKERPERVGDVDVNGDGRDDLVLWQGVGDLELKTDILVFLRGADHRLPKRPTQVLHCSGFPVYVGHQPRAGPAEQRISPVCALARDGRCELVLVTLKTPLTSIGGVVDAVLSGNMAWMLTIRTFNRGLFSASPDASISLTTMVPTEFGTQALFCIDGDFNGDGRLDVLVKASPTHWDAILSSARRWFAAKPALSFEVPVEGDFLTRDINADGLSDLVVRAWDEPTLVVFLSHSDTGKRQDRVKHAR